MANNRIYLRCKACGEEFFLGKRLLDGYWYEDYENRNLKRDLNQFYNNHTYCNGEGQDCFEISYEMEPEWDAEFISNRDRGRYGLAESDQSSDKYYCKGSNDD